MTQPRPQFAIHPPDPQLWAADTTTRASSRGYNSVSIDRPTRTLARSITRSWVTARGAVRRRTLTFPTASGSPRTTAATSLVSSCHGGRASEYHLTRRCYLGCGLASSVRGRRRQMLQGKRRENPMVLVVDVRVSPSSDLPVGVFAVPGGSQARYPTRCASEECAAV